MKKIAMIMVVAALSWITTGTMNAETFVKVTDASTLQDGDKVIMGCAAQNEVSAGFSSTYKFLNAATATFANNKVTVDNPKIITLKKSGNYWNLYFGTKVIGHDSGTSNLDGNKCRYTTKFAITITTNGTANIVSQTPGDDNAEVFFNHHNTLSRFSLYKTASPQTSIELYKLDESTIPEVVPTKVVLDKHEAELRMEGSLTLTATVTPDQAEDKSVSWGSMNESVATVVNGVVTPVAVGTAKIWVKTTKGENVTDTCVVTVLPALNTTKATYNIVQKADYLSAGAKVFFGSLKSGENYVMGRYKDGDNNIKAAAATYKDDVHHSVEAELQYAYTVQRAGDYYVFVDQDGYYMRTLTSSKLGKSEELDDYAKWEVGDFDQDEATVELKNVGCNKYLYYNHNSDLFNIYDYQGVSISSNFSRIVLFSSEAPEWADRVKNKWITVSTDYLDWGDEEKDEYATDYPWDTYRTLTITSNDLTDIIKVELKDDGNGTFYSYGDDFDPTTRTSETFAIDWKAKSKGDYNGRLEIRCDELDTTIVVLLHAKAVDTNSAPQDPPQVTASVDHVYLNPNRDVESSDFGYAEATLTFSVKNLQKTLYCTWHRDTQEPWFPYSNEWMTVSVNINNTDEQLVLNDKLDLGKDDRENVKVTIKVYAYNVGTYNCDIVFRTDGVNFFSIPITVTVSEAPQSDPTELESIESSEISSQKLIRNGQMLIIRNGEVYSVTGVKIND